MNLNCMSSRAQTMAESHLEAASKVVEETVEKLQVKETKSSAIERSIEETKGNTKQEQAAYLEWLQKRKTRLEAELSTVQNRLAHKKMVLQEYNELHA